MVIKARSLIGGIILIMMVGCSSTPFSSESDYIGVIKITFGLPKAGHVHLRVDNQYMSTIAVLVDRRLEAGQYSFDYPRTDQHGRRLPKGIYTYYLKTETGTTTGYIFLSYNYLLD